MSLLLADGAMEGEMSYSSSTDKVKITKVTAATLTLSQTTKQPISFTKDTYREGPKI